MEKDINEKNYNLKSEAVETLAHADREEAPEYSQEELNRDHAGIPHGGFAIRTGFTGVSGETPQMIEYSLNLGSNPEFTSSVLVCCARAVYRLHAKGKSGAVTIFDVPPALLSAKSSEELRRTLL